MTPPAIALQILSLAGITSLDPAANTNALNRSGVTQNDLDACAIAMTQALQEIFALGPVDLSEQRYPGILRPPASVSFTATQYSTAISGFTTWASWMEGCTVQGGDSEDNELLSATQLLRPFAGGSGPVSATVYADAIKLPDWVKNTIEPVETLRVSRLESASNREEFRFWNSPYRGDWAHFAGRSYYTSRTKTAGDPCVYFVEPRCDPTTGALPLFLRVNPMPGQATPITFRVKRKPPVITAADISAQSVQVTGTLVPDVTGIYALDGADQNNASIFAKAGAPSCFLTYNQFAGVWELYQYSGSGSTVLWNFTSASLTNPAGTYDLVGADSGAAVVSAPGGTDLVIPTDWHESILLPFAKKWFLSHPVVNNAPVAAQIMEQYRLAKLNLESFAPQISPIHGHYR